jgi:alkylation response protein AidB-like acyl-CoA dehydrogenase
MSAVRAEQAESTDEVEDLESFRKRARSFVRDNLRLVTPEELRWAWTSGDEEAELAGVARERDVQRMLFDAGLAGVCFPRAYGGQGLTPAHQRVLNEELVGHEYPAKLQVPTFSPCATVLLDFGTEEQKLRHIPAILRGEELWMQFLSEPSGGSDVAGALTTAVRDGDQWVLNGSKVWTTGAWWSDWGLCLARTNWDVPKHRGLTVFMLPIHQPGIEVHRIEMLNGSREFCQEFMTDVIIPDSDRVGGVDDGWTVGTRWMFHERMLYTSPYVTEPVGSTHGRSDTSAVLAIAREQGRMADPAVRDLVGEARMLELVGQELMKRVSETIRSGRRSDQVAAVGRLFKGTMQARIATLAFEVAGPEGAAWSDGSTAALSAINFLMRQAGGIGGGTVEMARNVISERVLSMPRERTLDRDVPFRDVQRSRSSAP